MYATEPPKKRVLHSSGEIAWSLCDNCPCMDVRDDTHTKKYEITGKDGYRYYCDAKKDWLTKKEVQTMNTAKCPLNKQLGRRGYA